MIELLVVVAIIAILASILLPTLGKAKERGYRSSCLGNLRQLCVAATFYVDTNDGWNIIGGYSSGPAWSRVLADQLQQRYIREQKAFVSFSEIQPHSFYDKVRNNGIFQCPAENFANTWGGRNAVSYRFNTGYQYGWGLGISDAYTGGGYHAKWGRTKLSDVTFPENTFVMGEALRGDGGYEYDIGQFRNTSYLATYHAGGGNLGFVDGHAAYFRVGDLTQDQFDRRR